MDLPVFSDLLYCSMHTLFGLCASFFLYLLLFFFLRDREGRFVLPFPLWVLGYMSVVTQTNLSNVGGP